MQVKRSPEIKYFDDLFTGGSRVTIIANNLTAFIVYLFVAFCIKSDIILTSIKQTQKGNKMEKKIISREELSIFNSITTNMLVAAARGEIDLNEVARKNLADRGLDQEGKWAGFNKAAELLKKD